MFWLHPKKTFHNLLLPTLLSDRLVPAGRDAMVLGGGFSAWEEGPGRGQRAEKKSGENYNLENGNFGLGFCLFVSEIKPFQ